MKKFLQLMVILVIVTAFNVLISKSATVERALNRWLGNFGYTGYYTDEQAADILIDADGHINFVEVDSLQVTKIVYGSVLITQSFEFFTVLDSVNYTDSTMTFYNSDGKTATLSFTTPN